MDPFARIRRSYHGEAARLLRRLQELRELPSFPGVGYSEEIRSIQDRLDRLAEREPSGKTWNIVELARHRERPQTLDYIHHSFTDLEELHGDRLVGDDPAVVGGPASWEGGTLMLIGQQKGRDLKDRQFRNFGMLRPEGYRKAQRLARLAEKFSLPVVTLVDTPGAFPGRDAEERGQARAIATTLQTFARLSVPTVSVIIGEGGSGGALAMALADRVFMLENSIYSVISPEGCAAILWRDSAEAPQAADALRLTAEDLLGLGAIDRIIKEPRRGAHRHHRAVAKKVAREVHEAIQALWEISPEQRRRDRRLRYLAMGRYASL